MTYRDAIRDELLAWLRYGAAFLIVLSFCSVLVGAFYLAEKYFGVPGYVIVLVLLCLAGRVMQRKREKSNG
jgi:ABC-type xylose transport system permease subunit